MADENAKEFTQVWKFLSQLKLQVHYDKFVEKEIKTIEDIYKLVGGEDAPERMMSGFGMNLNVSDAQLIFLGGTDIAGNETEEIDLVNLFYTLLQIGPNELIQKLFPCEEMSPEKLLKKAIKMSAEDLEGNPKVIEFLLKIADLNKPNKKGDLILFYVCKNFDGDTELIKLLLQHGADPHLKGQFGTSLSLALENEKFLSHFGSTEEIQKFFDNNYKKI
eukprot:TRINITY_DN8243_c0_g1_i1.p1 TRINITY_DN8243_c0_g1~~TRINITY_DN8243_c0_g1_i1.p1  ORF type:complete len:219 (-),score=73.15 TRINITY_DN8243_c0_g1_i1:81-737(-)